VLGSDDVALSGTAVGAFSDKTVGYRQDGYSERLEFVRRRCGQLHLNEPSLAADISPATIVVSGLSANNKVYDSTMSAALSGPATLLGVRGTDDVTLNGTPVGTFQRQDRRHGQNSQCERNRFERSRCGNYTYDEPVLVASIMPAGLTVSGLSANNKVYDQHNRGWPEWNRDAGWCGGQRRSDLERNRRGAHSATKLSAQPRRSAVSGLSLNGSDAGNYTLSQPTLAANITPAVLNVSGVTADNKAFRRHNSGDNPYGSRNIGGQAWK